MGAINKFKIIILHGWATTTDKWNPFLDALKHEKITPVMLPIPGLSAPIDKPWTLDDYAEWLAEILKNENRASILGHSNGGRIALAFAHKYPEKVKQLFLIDSAGIYHNDFLTNVKRRIFKTVSKIGKKITSLDTVRNALYKLTKESDYKEATPLMRETMKNLISVDLLPKLSEIKISTIIIWGKNDKVTPFKDALVMVNKLTNSKLFPITSARHSPQFTHIQEVIKIVKENLI